MSGEKSSYPCAVDPRDLQRAILECALDSIIMMDGSGVIREFNAAAQRTFGYTRAESVGRDMAELIIPARFRDAHRRGLARAVSTGEAPLLGRRLEMTAARADGTEFPVELTIARTADEPVLFIGYIRDLSRQKAAEGAVLDRARLASLAADVGTTLTRADTLRDMLQGCAEAVVSRMDAAFARIWTLNAAEQVLELQASAGLYTHLDGPHGQVPVGKFKIGLIAAEKTPHLTNEVLGDPRVGDQEWALRQGMVAFAGYPLMLGDEIVGVLAMFSRHPLTESDFEGLATVAQGVALGIARQRGVASLQQRAEQLAGLAGALERSNRELDQVNRAKDAFMATLSHELRTPLNAILGWAQLLRGGTLDESQTMRAVQTIVRNAQAQARLIEDLLDISRIATGKLQLEFGPVDLSRLIESLVESFQPDAAARNVTLTFETRESCHILADARRIQQVVGNLISNAIKFTSAGGRVTVGLGPCEAHAVVTVRDTGIGLDAEFLPRAFERFQQEETGSTRQFDGLGLGLNIVRHLVELHRGTVTADSQGRGHGATFTVSLPLVTDARAAADDGGGSAEERPLANIHVLCVDDNAESLNLMTAVLSSSGARVTAVQSAADGLRAIDAETPDVLISDIAMPHQDGYALIRAVRASPIASVRAIPAAAITAYATPADRARAADAGFQSHVAKPIQPETFTTLVAALAAASRRTRE